MPTHPPADTPDAPLLDLGDDADDRAAADGEDAAAVAAAAPGRRLFLIDGYSNIFRAFYAIQSLSSSKGEPTNAVYGFVNMLRKLLREEEPELLAVAWDVGGPTERGERFAEYKATRTAMPEDLPHQIRRIRDVLDAYRIPVLELPRWEADDVVGTIA